MNRRLANSRPGGRGRVGLVAAALGPLLALACAARAADQPVRPADALLRLVPPDAAAVVTVEGLRDQAHAFGASRLVPELRELPAVRAWLDSERYRQFERSRAQIEAFLGSSLAEIRDELLGDAVVLALRLPADLQPEPSQARGLLLVQVRDQALLRRVIRVINSAQQESGELLRVGDLDRNGTTYHAREFPAGANRLPEWYVTYPDGTFALSNSEALIQEVIDRKPLSKKPPGAGPHGDGKRGPMIEPGLAGLPRLQAVERRLPERALARLFIDPRPVARLIAASARPRSPAEGKILAMLDRYLAAVDFAGGALVWSDGSLKLHTVETLDPSKLDPWILRWAGDSRPFDPALGRLPPTALALIALHVDVAALHDAIRMVIPDADQAKLANFETILTGLLLGKDVVAGTLPRLGPGALVYLDAPDEVVEDVANAPQTHPHPTPLPLVLVVDIDDKGVERPPAGERGPGAAAAAADGASVADALDNALRTLLAVLALSPERAQRQAKITTRRVAGAAIHTLDIPIAFAYAVDRTSGRVIVSTSTEAIARYLEHATDSRAGERFRRVQNASLSKLETFGWIDLEAINRLASRHRESLVGSLAARQGRPVGDVDRDLTQVQALARLIDAVIITTRIDPQATAIERSIGAIFHDSPAVPARKP